MKIRKAELTDILECVNLSKIKEFETPLGFPSEEYLKESLETGLFFVAEKNNKILGFILGFKLTRKDVYLDLLTVRKEARGKEIGRRLINKFKEELRKQSVKMYFLIAPSFNKSTHSFYRKLGLKEGDEYILFCEKL
ncbi:MAG: GNAT family N-acetyltransferase [Candidatus Aenigmarchaeota archaeon]|nr:GNAT family N-acetyltransferase [Candidatus Aenigmarchaeota archaeon]